MPTTLSFKPGIDLPQWRPNAPGLAGSVTGSSLAWDMRNDISRSSLIFFLRTSTTFEVYDPVTDDWAALANPALPAMVAGSTSVFFPSAGPRGTLAAGATTTSVVLSTALPAAVGVNQLANKGGGVGYKIRVIGNAAGSSGKTEERVIVANTGGTTPTLTLDSALSFTPANGDAYEFLSGRVFLMGSGNAAGHFKYYDLVTNSYSGNLASAPQTMDTDSSAVALSELYVSSDRKPGEGFVNGGATYNGGLLGAIQATAAAAGTITGSGMPASLFADEYRNFQVRVVEDTTTPTSVGQRRLVSSHTGGAAGVFTLGANWSVTPSVAAKFTVENNDDLILVRGDSSTSVFSYAIGANTWSTATFAASGSAVGAGTVFAQAFGHVRDVTGNRRHSHFFSLRGANGSALDLFDIAAAAAGTWTNGVVYGGQSQSFTTGTCGAHDPVTLGGKYLHLNINGTQRFARLNMLTGTLENGTYLRAPQGVAVVGQKLAFNYLIDGATKLALLHHITTGQDRFYSKAVQF